MSSKLKVGTKVQAKADQQGGSGVEKKGKGAVGKRPQSGYMLFCQEKREELQRASPKLKAKEIIVELGRIWRELTEPEKAKYKAKALQKREEEAKEEEPPEEPKPSKKAPRSPVKSKSPPTRSKSPPKPEPKKAKLTDEERPVDEAKGKRGRKRC